MGLQEFQSQAGKPNYTYRHNPVVGHGFKILKRGAGESAFHPVGDYTVLDRGEDPLLSEKKVMNLIALLNGDPDHLIELGSETGTRLLYHRVGGDEAQDGPSRIIFYALGPSGVSRENAMLILDERN